MAAETKVSHTAATILHLASLFVPEPARSEWRREWKSELWYVRRSNGPALRFCLGAFQDALWMRRNCPKERRVCLQSPLRCVFLLLCGAAATSFLSFYLPGPRATLQYETVPLNLLWLGIALLLLPVATSISLGEYPHSPSSAICLRRWIFLGLKVALVLPAVSFGMVDAAQILCAGPPQIMFHSFGAIVGYIFALRWTIKDQRRRCPVCLRLLKHPARIGQSSRFLLDWHGTELMCEQGHGFLYVPGMPTASFIEQQWLYLDSSWKSLFL